MDNQEEDQELQEGEEGGSSSSKGRQEDPHPKTSSLTPPKVTKKMDPPPPSPSPIHEKTDADKKRDGLEQFKSYIMDKYGPMLPFEKTENRESPADSDTNQENAKQFELSNDESVETKSPVGPRNSPVTSADSKTNEEKDKRVLSDVEWVELKSPVVSGNVKTESSGNCHESPDDSSGNKASASLSTDNQEEEQELQDEEEEGPHPKTPSPHTPIHEHLQLDPSEETVESKPPVGPRNPPVVTSALKTGSKDKRELSDENRVKLKSPADSCADSPEAKRRRTQESNPNHKAFE